MRRYLPLAINDQRSKYFLMDTRLGYCVPDQLDVQDGPLLWQPNQKISILCNARSGISGWFGQDVEKIPMGASSSLSERYDLDLTAVAFL